MARITDRRLLGGHISTAGGISKSPERANAFSFRTMQIFSKNQMQWKARPLDENEVSGFKKYVSEFNLVRIMVHASYLLNTASTDMSLRSKVEAALREELSRADILGIDYLVLHPGSPGDMGEKKGIEMVAESINRTLGADHHVKVLLETGAGQGNTVGHKFEHLASMIDMIEIKEKVGICFDTCHVFAAGYDIKTPEGYHEAMDSFNSIIGLDKLLGFHLNDSKKGLGSHLDRHEQIGSGMLGLEGISNFINDPRLREKPFVLETPKGEAGYGEDIANLQKCFNGD